jgi:prevent-host-death family protein
VTKTVSATEVRVHFGELLRTVAEEGATYVVEWSGRPQAVVICHEEYEQRLESKPEVDLMEQLRRSQETFRPLRESGGMADIIELIREELEQRDAQVLNGVLGGQSDR